QAGRQGEEHRGAIGTSRWLAIRCDRYPGPGTPSTPPPIVDPRTRPAEGGRVRRDTCPLPPRTNRPALVERAGRFSGRTRAPVRAPTPLLVAEETLRHRPGQDRVRRHPPRPDLGLERQPQALEVLPGPAELALLDVEARLQDLAGRHDG